MSAFLDWLLKPPAGRKRRRGLGEQATRFADAADFHDRPPRLDGDGLASRRDDPPAPAPAPDAAGPLPSGPFPSTGPQGHRARMREKLVERGPDALADYELLEMLLFFAFKQGDTKPLAKALINKYGSFAGVLAAPKDDLLDIRGLGLHSVAALKLVQSSAIRLARAQVMDQPVLNDYGPLMEYLYAVMAREKVEQFRVLFLDKRNRLIADEAQSRGTVDHTPVYPREVCKRALALDASAILLVHNHPGGDPSPSREDIEMTREIRAAAAAVEIVLHDHVIVGNARYYSFRKEGLLGRG